MLRRCCFGVSPQEVDEAVARGLKATIDLLLQASTPIGPPLNFNELGEPNVPIGSTWITAPYLDNFQVNPYRSQSLNAWQLKLLLEPRMTLTPQLTLFWFNHFGAGRDGDPRLFYYLMRRYEAQALGNVRQLVKDVTVELQMLRFLNGEVNDTLSPNENFARELLELFTLGKGELAGPGDYTTFTEQDVRELARALTGWRSRNLESTDAALQPEAWFSDFYHDNGTKQLSPRLGSVQLQDQGPEEYKTVVDVIFAQPHAGDFLALKLYRWFVDYQTTPAVFDTIIEPLALLLKAADFELVPVLRTLLSSEHFFAARQRGSLVKNPFEFVVDLHVQAGFTPRTPLNPNYFYYRRLTWLTDALHMQLSDPPSVAGWPAYHQAPQFNRMWINAATIQERTRIANELIAYGVYYEDGVHDATDLVEVVAGFTRPQEVNALIDEWALRLLPQPVSTSQREALKQLLLPGLPDFEWTAEYQAMLDHPDDAAAREAIERKLRTLVTALVNAPQFHLK